MKTTLRSLLFWVGCCLFVGTAWALPNELIQEGLLMRNGQPLNGDYDIRVRLYSAARGGQVLFEEIHRGVPVINGYYAVAIGSENALPDGLFARDSVYFTVRIDDGDEVEPYLQAFGIAPGEQKRLPVIAMSRADTPLDVATLIEGTVRRGGVFTPGRHGGIRVEALGTPFTTLTDADGDFVLAVSAGEHTVRASVFGYGGMSMAVGQVDAGARFQIADPLVLTPQPGGVRGRVNLPPGFGFHAYGQLSVSLMPINAGPGEEPVATTTVLADGRWSLDGVTANAYGLTVKGGSFMPAYRTVDLEPGVVTDLGGINLIPSLNDADNIIIRGRSSNHCHHHRPPVLGRGQSNRRKSAAPCSLRKPTSHRRCLRQPSFRRAPLRSACRPWTRLHCQRRRQHPSHHRASEFRHPGHLQRRPPGAQTRHQFPLLNRNHPHHSERHRSRTMSPVQHCHRCYSPVAEASEPERHKRQKNASLFVDNQQ